MYVVCVNSVCMSARKVRQGYAKVLLKNKGIFASPYSTVEIESQLAVLRVNASIALPHLDTLGDILKPNDRGARTAELVRSIPSLRSGQYVRDQMTSSA